MLLRDLPRPRWTRVLDDLTAERAGTPTVVEYDGRTASRGLLLRSLSYSERDDTFEVTVAHPGANGEGTLEHLIDRPARIAVDGRDGIVPAFVAIDGADGVRTTVRLVAVPAISG